GASATHGPHHEANTFSTTTLPWSAARLVLPAEPRFGSPVLEFGATGNAPFATATSIDEFVFWLESPNASSASNAIMTATTVPGIKKRRIGQTRVDDAVLASAQ